MSPCLTVRYEADGFASALDWIVANFTPAERESWWWSEGGSEPDATCLLPRGHAEPHVWTPDHDIVVRFVDG